MLKRVLTKIYVFNIMLITTEKVVKNLVYVINKRLIREGDVSMENKLKEMKEFIILLDKLDVLMKQNILSNNYQTEETKEVLELLKMYTKEGILKNFEDIEEVAIIVDTVNGFMTGGALANPNAMHIVPKQIQLIEKILQRNGLVIFVKESHDENCTEFNTFPKHCVTGSWEAELVDELKPYEKHGITIEKNSTSFMFARGFLNLMSLMKNLKLVIGNGVCSDICIPNGFIPLKNYFNQNNRDVEIIIPINSIDTFNSPYHSKEEYEHASNILMKQSGIKLVKTINDIEWRRK